MKSARVAIAALALSASMPLWGQTSLGTITGTIQDQQGGGVPHVKVVVTNTATQLTYTRNSADDGTYVIPQLAIGAYELEATADGFKTYRQSGLNLEVGQRLRVDIRLDVGNVSESISVTAEIPRVQTEDSMLGTTVERKRIESCRLMAAMYSIW
ncbi:MAG: carboxypeptidase-like regulatory domain-containing protein [Bryobacteraceae bacterium]